MSWNTLESDPGVFVNLIQAFAPESAVDVVELWALDREAFPQPTHALLFLFKWEKGQKRRTAASEAGAPSVEPIFFKQTIGNACGTIALLHCIANMGVQLTPEVANFMAFAKELDPATRGDALEQNDVIRNTHNAFARPEPFVPEKDKEDDDEDPDVYHFIAYLPHGGGDGAAAAAGGGDGSAAGPAVWELDGLQPGPVFIGRPKVEAGEDWLSVASARLQERIAEYSAAEIRFNLLAITADARPGLRKRIAGLRARLETLYGAALSMGNGEVPGDMQAPDVVAEEAGAGSIEASDDAAGSSLPTTMSEVSQAYDAAGGELRQAGLQLQDEEAKHARYAVENARRRHNFVPFLMEALSQLGQRGQLLPLYEAGRKKAQERQRAAAEGAKGK